MVMYVYYFSVKLEKKCLLKAKMLKTPPLRLEVMEKLKGCCEVWWNFYCSLAPSWSVTGQFTNQINKELKFCSKGITEVKVQQHREITKGARIMALILPSRPSTWGY